MSHTKSWKVIVFDTHRFEADLLRAALPKSWQAEFLNLRLSPATAELVQGYDAVVVFVNDDCSAAVLKKLKERGASSLVTRSAGYNHIDLDTARSLGIRVANVPEYSPHAVAEHTIALMLALNRKLIRAHNRVRDLNFSLEGLIGFDLYQKTVGIIGLGKIGRVVAKILNGFGCRVLGYDLDPEIRFEEGVPVTKADLKTIYQESDIITLHLPLTKDNRYMINKESLSKMKKGVMLINTSRGGLVKTKDVIDALKSGQIGYLGIDVYEEEVGLFFEDHSEDILLDDVIARLLTFPNVLITSHQAFLTKEALKKIVEVTTQNLRHFQMNQDSPNQLA